METHVPTTPFGRRPVTLGQIATRLTVRQALAEAGQPGSNRPAAVNKWKLFRTLTEVRARLGVSDRSLSVLNALLSFQQETALSLPGSALPCPPPQAEDAAAPMGAEGQGSAADTARQAAESCELVVFPSNKALSLRAHGMAPATLRRHLAALVEAGLILRRDSPNGKRYARADAERGEDEPRFSEAFGFDLAPLVARAPEFEALAEEQRRERRALQQLKERITLHRRDCAKLIACGLDEGLLGDWETHRQRFMALLGPLRAARTPAALARLAESLHALRAEVTREIEQAASLAMDRANSLGAQGETDNMSANESQSERHQSNSNAQWPSDLEPASKEEGGPAPTQERVERTEQAPETKALPLGMVLEACPDIQAFSPRGPIRDWAGFDATAALIRPMLGISPDAWREALAVLGDRQAHVAVAAILQRSEHSSEARTVLQPTGETATLVNGSPAIRSAGGYLRALTEKARAGEFALGPVLMALIGQRLKARRAGGSER